MEFPRYIRDEFKKSIILGVLAIAHSQTINGPTLLTSAGAIVLLICSTAFETPARDKQTMTDPDRRQPCRAGKTDDYTPSKLMRHDMRDMEPSMVVLLIILLRSVDIC